MAEDRGDAQELTAAYDTMRRRQSVVIAELLEFLPRLDGLPPGTGDQLRDALLHADHPFLIVFVGPFSAGKSSIINALMGRGDLMPVGVTPTTDHISILRYGEQQETLESDGGVTSVFYPSPLLQKVSFVDTPGLESVFRGHEEITRNFLHRADIVFLVMLATQAMTAENLASLQQLKRYGTRVIVLVNQIDLLSEEEARSVLDFVREESRAQLESEAEVWPLSARDGQEAWRAGTLDEAAWRASGMQRIVHYVDRQLGDVTRLRQKLRTPMQITRNVLRVAEESLNANQVATERCENISANIEEQLLAQRRDQEAALERIVDEAGACLDEAGAQVHTAVRDLYRISRGPDLFRRGLLELVGLGGLTRRDGGRSYVERVFAETRVRGPLDDLPAISARTGPRLEGQDMQDLDDLVGYAGRELDALPPAIQAKLIGELRLPQTYDRRTLEVLPARLEETLVKSRWPDTEALDRQLRNNGLYLVVYEILLLVAAIFISQVVTAGPEFLLLLLATPLLMLAGFVILPLRGRVIAAEQTRQLRALRERYCAALREAALLQMERGMQLRRDTVAPLTRLVIAQTQLQRSQRTKLQHAARELDAIEAALPTLGAGGLLQRALQITGGDDAPD